VLGLGLSMVVRNSTAAIGGLLVWAFVVENLFRLFLADEIARFLPFVAGNHLLSDGSGFESAEALAVALTRPENALVFGGYTLVAVVLGTVLLYRRDTN
jgi:ABC-2 type transport system permease protein